MGTYDDWKCATPEQYRWGVPARGGCKVCGGGDEPPCSEACGRIHARRQALAFRDSARLALRLVRRYRAEGDGLESPRLVATLARYGELRGLLRAQVRAAR